MDVTIPLDADLSAFVESQVRIGRFASSGDLIREALHLLRSIDFEEVYSGDKLVAAWQVGIDSGDAGEIDFEDLKKETRGRTVDDDAGVLALADRVELGLGLERADRVPKGAAVSVVEAELLKLDAIALRLDRVAGKR